MANINWPKGISPRGKASIRINFQYPLDAPENERMRRETLNIVPSAEGAKEAKKIRDAVVTAIRAGTFTLQDYEKYFPNSKWLKQNRNKVTGEAIGYWVEQMWDWFEKWQRDRRPKASWVRSVKIYLNMFEDRWGKKYRYVHELTEEVFREFVSERQDAGTATRTIKNNLAPMRAFLRAHRASIPYNPLADFVIVKTEDEVIRDMQPKIFPFDIDELQKLIAKAHEIGERIPYYKQVANMIQFWAAEGCRPGEVYGLAYEAVNFVRSQYTINKAWVEGKLTTPKEACSIRTNDFTAAGLAAVLDQKKYTFARSAYKDDRYGELRFVFLKEDGTPFKNSAEFSRCAWNYVMKLSGLPYRPPRHLRHTFACIALSVGEHEEYIWRHMGHADNKMLRQHYGKILMKKAAELSGNIGGKRLDEVWKLAA